MLHCFVKVDQFVLVVVIVYQFPTQICLAGFNIETRYSFHYVWAFYQLLSTCYQLFLNFLSTFINCLSTFNQLLINLLSTIYQLFYQLFINCLSTFSQLFLNFFSTLSTFYQLFINFLSTFYQLFINFFFINCLSTVYQLFLNFFQLYQLFINVLSTLINCLSTFQCFSFMSYISALPNIIFALHSQCSIDQSSFASYVSGAPQLRSPPAATNMHLKMILKFVYLHCLMHPPQQPLKGPLISMCNLQSVMFRPSTSWSTSITVIL